MFFGTYFHQMDAKNRIRIPSKFSKELGESCFIGRSAMGNALAIYTPEAFAKISKKNHSPFNASAESAYTKFFSTYFNVNEDGHGRMLINETLIKLGHLEKDVVFIGADDHINLMSKSAYDALNDEMSYEDALAILDAEYEKHLQ